ncbi:MAG TPA: phospholipase D-like domain-containing protein [Spirillospora sp.]|nr:phospholipase D-like domain-containing protein [Spirillospora sp.]
MPAAYLVESIPTGLEDFRSPDGHYTEDTLLRLVQNTRHTIDLTAMYWTLNPDPTRVDEMGLTEERLAELGGDHGRRLFEALADAAARSVRIRILQSPGFGDEPEAHILLERFPQQVEIRQIDMTDWYQAGIMHHKLWVFDRTSFYLGSANMDWRSLTQVKELGIVVEDDPALGEDITRFFETWWHVCSLQPDARLVFDPAVRIERYVPAWSDLVAAAERAPNPLDQPALRTPFNIENPMSVTLNGVAASAFITSSPPEMCPPGRTFDLDALLYAIHDARESICLSFMNFVPLGFAGGEYDEADDKIKLNGAVATPLWWPDLIDALLRAAISRSVHVRLLVGHWPHTSAHTAPCLRALRAMADAARADHRLAAGQIEVKWFIIPGWDRVAGVNRAYPEHSRVNHPKYVVTDRRLIISTSNISWDYFATVSGTSFNTDHPELTRQLQAIFDRDWNSRCAYPLV